jgi:hypothetical protein
MQQEMFKKWVGLMPGLSVGPAASPDKLQEFQKKWAAAVNETFKQRREFVETQFKAGLQNIETAFTLGEAGTPEELHARTVELWKKCFESIRQVYEFPMRDFQAGFEKWAELTAKIPA